MDVVLHQSSVFDLPSSRRVGAIVHDGTTDLRLWPAPGADRQLQEAYGPDLQDRLDRERGAVEGGALPIGGLVRVFPGRLHCDFLLWVGSRPPEDMGIRAPAPRLPVIEKAVDDALRFVAQRSVIRVAFGVLGEGPEEVDPVARMVAMAKAAQRYYDGCFADGRPPVLEEVLLCDRSGRRVSEARRKLGRLVKSAVPVPRSTSAASTPRRRRVVGGASKGKTGPGRRRGAPRLSEDEVGMARATGGPYDRHHTYGAGDYLLHAKFGVGRVQELTPEGFILVLFEDGQIRRMLHAR
jgi:hypothetical protein